MKQAQAKLAPLFLTSYSVRYNDTNMYSFTKYEQAESLPFDLPFPQTNLYKELQQEQGFEVEQFVIKKEEKTIGFFQITVYPLIKNKTSIYIPHGPVMTESNPELLHELAMFLKQLGQDKNCVFVRTDFSGVTPDLLPPLYKSIPDFAYKTVYHQPRGEWILDITPTEEALLANMHKKTRYNVNKSIRENLETQFYAGKNLEPWADTFIALNDQNTKEHNTTTHPKQYFKTLFLLAAQSDDNFIAVTRKEGHVLAINIFIKTGNQYFCPFGASNDVGKKLGAYYHIKWHSIIYMKQHGGESFNWGGVSVGMNDDYLSGVTKFKTGFGGSSLTHLPLHDIVIQPFWYHLYMLRKRIKK